jgi:hypothetical protein
MQPVARAYPSLTLIPTRTRWRVSVDVEVVVEAEDQEAAISEAEDLMSQVMPIERAPREAKVDVVMSLPIRLGWQG